MAFGWSWSFWFLQMAGVNLYVAPFGPFVAAFVMTYIREGKEGVKKILKRGFDPRIGKVWYIPVFLLWPLITGFSMLGVMLSEGGYTRSYSYLSTMVDSLEFCLHILPWGTYSRGIWMEGLRASAFTRTLLGAYFERSFGFYLGSLASASEFHVLVWTSISAGNIYVF
ncbi:MAG: hypothetical protein QW491_12570 [Thermoproteota archaeon]